MGNPSLELIQAVLNRFRFCPKCRCPLRSYALEIRCNRCDKNWTVKNFLMSVLKLTGRRAYDIIKTDSLSSLGKHANAYQMNMSLKNNWNEDITAIKEFKRYVFEPQKAVLELWLGFDSENIVIPSLSPDGSVQAINPISSEFRVSSINLSQGVIVSNNPYNAINLKLLGYHSVQHLQQLAPILGHANVLYLNDETPLPKVALELILDQKMSQHSDNYFKNIITQVIPPIENIVLERPIINEILTKTGRGMKNLLKFYIYIIANGRRLYRNKTIQDLNISKRNFDNLNKLLAGMTIKGVSALEKRPSPNIAGVYKYEFNLFARPLEVNKSILNIISNNNELIVLLYVLKQLPPTRLVSIQTLKEKIPKRIQVNIDTAISNLVENKFIQQSPNNLIQANPFNILPFQYTFTKSNN
jgi:hypothetical protein